MQTNVIRPTVIQNNRHCGSKRYDVVLNWNVAAASKLVSDGDTALKISKIMINKLYSMIIEGQYIPQICFIETFDKNRVSYDESLDGEMAFIRYHNSDNWKNYTENDDEFYDDSEVIFMSTFMNLNPFDEDDDKYEYYEVFEGDYEVSEYGSYFLCEYDDEFYGIALGEYKDGVVSKGKTLDDVIVGLETYLSKSFDLPKCIYFEITEGDVV